MTEKGADDPARGARLLARCALLAAAAGAVFLLTGLGTGGLLILLSGLVGLACSAAGLWWFLAHRGPVRLLGAVLAVGAPLAVLSLYIIGGLWLTALVALGLWGVGLLCGRAALRRLRAVDGGGRTDLARGVRRPRPRRPVLIMNPKSGDGKVESFGLVERAERLGARVILLDPSVESDVTELAREAVADGADLLGVAGGDGTQALVAAVAAEHDLPFLVISAGTRNHFALDLGLDRSDPAKCLDALVDGEELRVDLGSVSGRPFVNTVSFGVYADVVQRPEYRDAKAGTALDALPDLLQGGEGDRLDALIDGVSLPAQQALLVSNNPYATPDPFGAGAARRPRLDSGALGVIGIRVEGAAQAAELAVRGSQATGLNVLTAARVEVAGKTEAAGSFGPGGGSGPEEDSGPGTGADPDAGPDAEPVSAPDGASVSAPDGGPGPGAGPEPGANPEPGADPESGANPEPGPGRNPGPPSDPVSPPLRTAAIAVAVDGEALIMPTPVVCTLRPRALRVLVPRHRPGAVDPQPPMDWRRVARLAFPSTHHPAPRSGT